MMATVVIDPGHGGSRKIGGSSANNATGPAGTLEKTLTLDIARRAVVPLRALGHRVELTRSSDVNSSLAARAGVARRAAAAVFVSIHFNGFKVPTAQGTETWTHFRAGDRSRRLADALQRALLKTTRYRDRGLQSKELGALDPDRHHPDTAACLVEISFITDPADEERLQDESYRDALAASMADGIGSFLSPPGFTAPSPQRKRPEIDCPMLDESAPAGRVRLRASPKKPRQSRRRKSGTRGQKQRPRRVTGHRRPKR